MTKNESLLLSPVASGLCDDCSCKTPQQGPTSPFSPETLNLLRMHFWCDFGDVIPLMVWDETPTGTDQHG